jgi:hypothetical protein
MDAYLAPQPAIKGGPYPLTKENTTQLKLTLEQEQGGARGASSLD